MTKIYEYDERVIIEFDNLKRANYNRKKYGELLDKVIKQAAKQQEKIWNPYEVHGDIALLFVWAPKNSAVIECPIDTEDLSKVSKYYWGSMTNNEHLVSKRDGDKKFLHHFVLGLQRQDVTGCNLVVDHINMVKTDNRKQNLRIGNSRINQWNQKIHADECIETGITKRGNRWRVTGSPRLGQKEMSFDCYDDAVRQRLLYVDEIKKDLGIV